MYTRCVRRTPPPKTELGRTMQRWRETHGVSMDAAAEQADIAKSTWSDLEAGKRKPEIETLFQLETLLGIPMADLARQSGFTVRVSRSVDERVRRYAALVEADARFGALIDVLSELNAAQIDTMVSVAESLAAQNRSARGLHQRDEE